MSVSAMRSATLSIGMAAIRHDMASLGSSRPYWKRLAVSRAFTIREPAAELPCFDAEPPHWQSATFRRHTLSGLRQLLSPPLALLLQRLAHELELCKRCLVGARKAQVEGIERADDRGADHHAREPFVIGRHHVPWRRRTRSMPDVVRIHGHVSRPQCALGDIGHRKLPVLRGIVEPVEKPLALLLPGEVEEEFQDHDAVAREITLDRRNILKPLAPDVSGDLLGRYPLLLQQFRMHPRHQAFFIMGAIEDADMAARRQRDHVTPHEIMIKLMRRRLLERMNLTALRIDAVEDGLDGAVLAGRIHSLKNQQQRPAILCVKLFLKVLQPSPVGFEDLFTLVLIEAALLIGLVRPEMKCAGAVETERRDKGL